MFLPEAGGDPEFWRPVARLIVMPGGTHELATERVGLVAGLIAEHLG